MKKALSLLLIILLILGSLTFASCSLLKGVRFLTIGDLLEENGYSQSFLALDEVKQKKDAYVYQITKDDVGEIEIPNRHYDKPVIAVIAANSENDAITSLKFSDSVKYIEDLGSMKQLENSSCPVLPKRSATASIIVKT